MTLLHAYKTLNFVNGKYTYMYIASGIQERYFVAAIKDKGCLLVTCPANRF